MDSTDREQNVFLARLSGQAGRYELTKDYIKNIINTGVELNADEQKLMSFAYSKLEHALRDSWRVVWTYEQEEKKKSDGGHAALIAKYRADIEQELEKLCDEVIGLVKNNITPNATTDETRIFCLKMSGDYNRYIAECATDERRAARLEAANEAYNAAVKFAQDQFDGGNPHRLSLIVNAAVFYHDYMNKQEYAIGLIEGEVTSAAGKFGDGPEDEETRAIMGILVANMEIWKADDDH